MPTTMRRSSSVSSSSSLESVSKKSTLSPPPSPPVPPRRLGSATPAAGTSPFSHANGNDCNDDDNSNNNNNNNAEKKSLKEKPATWASLPRKDQLFILAFTRLAEPVFQTSITAYVVFMLRSFDPSRPDSALSTQAGFLSAGFTATQCLTAVLWGKVADHASVGRKNVLIIGLLGTIVSAIGFGFSRSFASALFFRALGGALNGNVSVLRTMTSEVIREKRYQTKAFLLMPIMFNCGILLGPLLGGWLQDPVHGFPASFGAGSKLGGAEGVAWMLRFPYALPNIANASLLCLCLLLVVFGLEEAVAKTHVDRQHLVDPGLRCTRAVARILSCRARQPKYVPLQDHILRQYRADTVDLAVDDDADAEAKTPAATSSTRRQRLPLRRILRRNVLLTFLTHGLIATNTGAFQNLWFLFLSTYRANPASPVIPGYVASPPLFFTGGLGFTPATIGTAVGLVGAMGLMMQFGLYSWVVGRLGVLRAFRYALLLFPLAYALAPFLALVPTTSAAPHPADGAWLWAGIVGLLCIVVLGRTFALPLSLILVNNCTPHPSVLSTVHGIAQSVSAGCRTLGPLVFSTVYGQGLKRGVVGLAWWTLAIEALCAFGVSWLVYEGSGHEVWLEGDV